MNICWSCVPDAFDSLVTCHIYTELLTYMSKLITFFSFIIPNKIISSDRNVDQFCWRSTEGIKCVVRIIYVIFNNFNSLGIVDFAIEYRQTWNIFKSTIIVFWCDWIHLVRYSAVFWRIVYNRVMVYKRPNFLGSYPGDYHYHWPIGNQSARWTKSR